MQLQVREEINSKAAKAKAKAKASTVMAIISSSLKARQKRRLINQRIPKIKNLGRR